MNDDLKFVAGDFIHGDVPADKEYLKKYFNSKSERVFLSYYFLFSHLYRKGRINVFCENFYDHTGYFCSQRWMQYLLSRMTRIETALKEAEKAFDLSRVGDIRAGKVSFPKKVIPRVG